VDVPLRQKREGGCADGVEVRLGIDHLAEHLLGRHERRRPDDAPARPSRRDRPLDQPRHAEIEHLEDSALGEKQVLRLDVAVNDPLGVSGRQDVEHLVHEPRDLARTQPVPAPFPPVIERFALEQLHDEED
jgi:hypothetical protein